MPYEYIDQEVFFFREIPCLKIANFFGQEKNKQLFEMTQSMKDAFVPAKIAGAVGSIIDKNIRDALTCNAVGTPIESMFLEAVQSKFLHEVTDCSCEPICQLSATTVSETQISRYGTDQNYDWHIDKLSFRNTQRVVTLVYWFFKEPKAFEGGELVITNEIIYQAELFESHRVDGSKGPSRLTIPVENDCAVIFGCRMPHTVLPVRMTTDAFDSGRFSVNMWLGFQPAI